MPENATPRISVADLRARSKNRVVEDGGRKIVQQNGDEMTDIQLARAARETKFATFLSKIRELRLVRRCERKLVVDGRVVVEPEVYIEFKNYVYKCKDAEEEAFMLKCPDFNRRYWRGSDYVELINAEKQKIIAEESEHQKLLKRELLGEVADPRDRELTVGMQVDPDKLSGKPYSPDGGDMGLPLVEDGD